MRGLCAARRVSPWMHFATQTGTLVIMPGDKELQGHEEEVFLDGLPPLRSSTSEISMMASTPREHAQYDPLGGPKGSSTHVNCLFAVNEAVVNVGKDDLVAGIRDCGCFSEYVGKGTGGTSVRSSLPVGLASEVGYTGNDQPKKTCSRFVWVSRGRCSFVKMSRTTVRSRDKC